MTDKDTNKRKLEVGIRDFSNNIKYVNRSEEIDYKFSIEKVESISVLLVIIMIKILNY